MARFITGEEITEVIGAVSETFIKEREIPAQGSAGGIAAGAAAAKGKMGVSDVDDATLFLARFTAGRWPLSKRHALPPATRTRTASRSTAKKARSASTSRT